MTCRKMLRHDESSETSNQLIKFESVCESVESDPLN